MPNLFLHYFLLCVSKRGHQTAPASTPPPPNTSSYTGRTLVHHVFHAVVHSMRYLNRTQCTVFRFVFPKLNNSN